jgi:hypothetical protein
MAQITVQKPVAQVVAFENVSAQNFPVEPGFSFGDAAIVVLSVVDASFNGNIQPAPVNVTNTGLIAGIAQHASSSVMTSGTSTRDVFGYFQASPMVSNSNAQVIVVPLGDVPVEINLTTTTYWMTGAPAATATTTVAGAFVAGNTLTTTIGGISVTYEVTGLEGSDEAIATAVAAQANAYPPISNQATAGTPVAGVIPWTAAIGGTTGNTLTIATANTGAGTYTASGATFAGGSGFDAFIGTPVGLNIDPATGYYVADPLATNKVASITGKPNSVFTLTPSSLTGAGNAGDLGARVDITFYASALALQVGH